MSKLTNQKTAIFILDAVSTSNPLFVKPEMLEYSIFTNEYFRELFSKPVETKWQSAVSDLNIMLSGTFVLPGGWRLTGVAHYLRIPFEII
jgi:hypothetical protein